MEDIEYLFDEKISADQFIDILNRSTLGERRPVDDKECMQGMLDNCNLSVTAWQGSKLVGIARCVTDFHYCCYLSDLAVDASIQQSGIGKELQKRVQSKLHKHCKLILLAAPAAHEYYGKVGYTAHERCWVLDRDQQII